MKTKVCSFCNKEVQRLFYSNPKCCPDFACKKAYNQLKSKKGISSPVKIKQSKINPISNNRAKQLKEYRVKRDKFLKDNPFCARCGSRNNLTLQHLSGREGNRLTDESNFMTLCWPCHQWATEYSKEAIEQGYAKSRLKK